MSDHSQSPADDPFAPGLRCWRCGHDQFRVIYTRRRLTGLQRRRECLRCGTRFTTCERRLGA
jgi:transcriptional regulator NrdR family protein